MYQTEQRKTLLRFLKSHPERQFTVAELAEALDGSAGESTVYRLVNKLRQEGLLRAFPGTQGRGSVYQYHQNSDCQNHLHLKCRLCGNLAHLECDRSDELLTHILAHHGFCVDPGASTLFGLCRRCAAKESVLQTAAGCHSNDKGTLL